jgi:3-deoxy-7-phosphoheptulonate synthase/chorismate mutase
MVDPKEDGQQPIATDNRSAGMSDGGGDGGLEALRKEIGLLNHEVLELLSRRGRLVERILEIKKRSSADLFSPSREQEMLGELILANRGPFPDEVVRHLFRQIFRASLDLMERTSDVGLRVARGPERKDTLISVGDVVIGAAPVLMAGPCAIESESQLETVAAHLASRGVRLLRGGAYKARTSPYAFQGLGDAGVRLLADAGRRHGMATICEVLDAETIESTAPHIDILQIGARNMANFRLLRAAGGAGRPVLLKRGFAATLDELMRAAEYLVDSGCDGVILCERGIRTFETETRFTLDLAAVPILRRKTLLPVIVDVSHSTGRRDIQADLARASLAAGAHGVMLEVHPTPETARSDGPQQLDLPQFDDFLEAIRPFLAP